ncbi:MAG TPA: adenosylmethionine decarboxylase [Candidatus Brocadiia bacterium]|nr:adenosylmethionine decarboxylase [Planctomycetota bacterium]MDO8092004.1 adenosylmethionine decarboxylase [Candidatus Brocadiales bacterium]
MEPVGKHLILELWECDVKSLNSITFVRDLITTAARKVAATVLDVVCHRFTPTGVTGVVVLAESHISIHTWPERAYAAIDIFTCGNTINPQDAASYLVERLCAKNSSMLLIERGRKARVTQQTKVRCLPSLVDNEVSPR